MIKKKQHQVLFLLWLFIGTLTQATAAPCGIPKGLNSFHFIDMSTVGAVNFFANLGFYIRTAPPFTTAFAMKVVEKFEGNFHKSQNDFFFLGFGAALKEPFDLVFFGIDGFFFSCSKQAHHSIFLWMSFDER